MINSPKLILGLFVQSLVGAILCCVLFGFGIGGVAAFMNVIYAEILGIGIIQVRIEFINI